MNIKENLTKKLLKKEFISTPHWKRNTKNLVKTKRNIIITIIFFTIYFFILVPVSMLVRGKIEELFDYLLILWFSTVITIFYSSLFYEYGRITVILGMRKELEVTNSKNKEED